MFEWVLEWVQLRCSALLNIKRKGAWFCRTDGWHWLQHPMHGWLGLSITSSSQGRAKRERKKKYKCISYTPAESCISVCVSQALEANLEFQLSFWRRFQPPLLGTSCQMLLLQGVWALLFWEPIWKPSLNTQTTVYFSESCMLRTWSCELQNISWEILRALLDTTIIPFQLED